MSTVKKILQLIPENWEDVLVQAHQFETDINTARAYVTDQEATVNGLLGKLLALLNIDWQKVHNWLVDTDFYEQLDKIPLDIPAWLATPEGFDWDDSIHLDALMREKFDLLKLSLSHVSFTRRSGGIIDTSLAVEQLKSVVEAFSEVASNIDFEDADSVALFRTRATESVKPKVFALIETLFGIDLQDSSASTGTDSIINLPQKLADAQPQEPVQPDPTLGENVVEALDMLSKAKYALPVLLQELELVSDAQTPLNDLLTGSEDFVVHLEQHLPALADALQSFLSAQDWQELDFEQLKVDLSQLFTLVQAYIESSPLTAGLLNMFSGSGDVYSLVKLVGFEDGLTTEQKLIELVTQAVEVFTLPTDYGDYDPKQLVSMLKTKIDSLISVLNHIEVFGGTIDNLYKKVKSPLEQLLSTDDADLSTPDGVMEFVFDKVILLAKLINPLGDSTQNNSETTSNSETGEQNSQQTSDADSSGLTGIFAGFTGNVFQFLMKLIQESLEKAKLIWRFVKDNNLAIRLDVLSDDFQPAKLHATNYQIASGAADASVANSGEDQSTSQSTIGQSSATNETGSELDSETGEGTVNTPSVGNVVSLEKVIRNLLGDRNSGVISYLPADIQDMILGIMNGEFQQQIMDDLTQLFQDTGGQQAFEQQYQALIDLQYPQTSEDGQPVAPPTAATVFSQIVAGFGQVYSVALSFVQQTMTLMVDLLFKVIDTLFAVLNAFKVPQILRNILPHQIEYALFGEQDPNLICLLVAIPTVILTGFLTVPVETLSEWIAEAV